MNAMYYRALSHAALPQNAPGAAVVAVRGGQALTHAQFAHDVQRWCAAWSGVPGSDVALYFEDAFAFAAALFGAWHAGKTPVLMADRQPATVRRVMPLVCACAGQLDGALELPAAGPVPELRPLRLAQTRLAVFTSGSSGEPLRIAKHLAQLDAEVHALQALFGTLIDRAQPATVWSTVSHQHIYGLLFRVLWPLATLRPFAVQTLQYPEEIVARLADESQGRGAVLVTSPAMLSRLPEALDWAAARPALRGVFSSGGPLPAEASSHALVLMGQSPIEVFGSSETGGIAWRSRAEHGDAWNALPGVEWRVDDGLLAVRSAHLEDARDWWLTSDRAEPLPGASGFVLKGRMDRIVKVAEKRVSLTALEAALLDSGLVQQARAVMLGDGAAQRIGVVTLPSESGWRLLEAQGRKALNGALRDVLAQHVERVALPRQWRHVEQLPVNPQGKTTQEQLARLFSPTLPRVQWLERLPAQARGMLDVDAGLLVFDGHFPRAPLVPGVAQLDWVTALAGQCFAMPRHFQRAQALKFQRPILPGAQVTLAMRWDAGQATLHFTLSSDAGEHAQGSLVYGVAA